MHNRNDRISMYPGLAILIKEAREKLSISRDELAWEIKVPVKLISLYERDKSDPNPKNLKNICDYLKIPIPEKWIIPENIECDEKSYQKTCKGCEKIFYTHDNNLLFCAVSCRPRIECVNCGKAFPKCLVGTRYFCSRACSNVKNKSDKKWKDQIDLSKYVVGTYVKHEKFVHVSMPQPDNYQEILKNYPDYSIDNLRNLSMLRRGPDGKKSHRLNGIWISCIGCSKIVPTIKSSRKRYCNHACSAKSASQEKHYKWTGGKYVDLHGYTVINILGKGRIMEHRHIMEEHLGRTLLVNENIHHKDGNRSNNDLSNLELWTKQQPAGQRVEDKIKFCIEFLTLYKENDDVKKFINYLYDISTKEDHEIEKEKP